MTRHAKVSIIVPTYNESANVSLLIDQIHQELLNLAHEIIVVDDNSSDGTYGLVLGLKRDYVRALLRIERPSLAESIRLGLENATGDILVVMDSDFNHQPKYLPLMISNLQYYDMVSASRYLYGGAMDSRLRHILSFIFNIFVRVLTGKHITDSLYGFFAIHRAALTRLDFDKIFWGYGDYCIRLMYYVQELNLSILQFPAVNGRRLRGQVNRRFLRTFGQYTTETLKLCWRERLKIKSGNDGQK